MISYKKYLFLSISFLPFISLTQALDSSILSQLTPEQLVEAQEILKDDDTADIDSQELPEIEETTIH